jgi:hypothetical protein
LGVLDVVEVDVVVVVGFAVDGEGGGDISGEVAQVAYVKNYVRSPCLRSLFMQQSH